MHFADLWVGVDGCGIATKMIDASIVDFGGDDRGSSRWEWIDIGCKYPYSTRIINRESFDTSTVQ